MCIFSLERTYLLILGGICCWEYQGTAGHRDTYLEQQQTEKLETEVREGDRIQITKVYRVRILFRAGLRIRIDLMRIRIQIQHFFKLWIRILDPDPGSGSRV